MDLNVALGPSSLALSDDTKKSVRAVLVARSTIGGLRIARLVERATQKPHAEYV